MRRLFWTLGLLLLMRQSPALAWESLPEFQSLTEAEQEKFESPLDLETEYFSDVLAYQKPMSWEYLWLTHEQALDISVGSVSAQEFMMDNRLKIQPWLLDELQFRFTHFEERSLERDSVHNMMELIYWPQWWPGWVFKKMGIAFYGEPSLNKRENDTGVALFFKPHDRHEIRIFETYVDVTRLKRNNRSDTFAEPNIPRPGWEALEQPQGGSARRIPGIRCSLRNADRVEFSGYQYGIPVLEILFIPLGQSLDRQRFPAGCPLTVRPEIRSG
jgi:hypothetical protein